MVSDFILTAAAVAALAPKSHGPWLLAWARKYADTEFQRDYLDTAGRILYFLLIVVACALIEAAGL